MPVQKGCGTCGGIHFPMKFKFGDRVRATSMMSHILRNNPFGCRKVDHTGDSGVIVKAVFWERIMSSGYIVNFEPDPTKAWEQAPFDECMLEADSSVVQKD
jgi:hypothetical protein